MGEHIIMTLLASAQEPKHELREQPAMHACHHMSLALQHFDRA